MSLQTLKSTTFGEAIGEHANQSGKSGQQQATYTMESKADMPSGIEPFSRFDPIATTLHVL